MNLVVDLPPELEAELSSEASRLQLPVAEYIVRVLAAGRFPEWKPNNGAELVEYWRNTGVVGSRTDISDAAEHARLIRNKSEKRERS